MHDQNPLLLDTPFPPLEDILPAHFVPAALRLIAQAEIDFEAMRDNPSPADFENVVVALEQLFYPLSRLQMILSCFYGNAFSPEIVEADRQISGLVWNFSKKVFQDRTMAMRFKAITQPEDAEEALLYKNMAQSFESEGAFLDSTGQQRLREIDDALVDVCSRFEDNLQQAPLQLAFLVTDAAMLAGLPEAVISALRQNAADAGHAHGWLFIPERLLVDSLLECAENRDFRRQMHEVMNRVGTVAPYDNAPLVKEILALRQERATLLGYPHYAAYALARTMAGSLDRAESLLLQVDAALAPRFEKSMAEIKAFAASHGGVEVMEPWDVSYWASRFKATNLAYDSQELRQYLPLDEIHDGFFSTVEKLFSLRFMPTAQYPVYHPDVRTYSVVDMEKNMTIGVLYLDLFARRNKQGGAWMNVLQHAAKDRLPIITFTMNLLKPEGDQPVLLSMEDLETYFHEGGHALHGLLGANVRFQSLQGVAASSDYTEFHSMIMENWGREGESMKSFARHHANGESIPGPLLSALHSARDFMKEKETLKVVQNSLRDFTFHKLAADDYAGVDALHALADRPYAQLVRAYPLTRFSHIFSSPLTSYAAGYYGYLWAEVLQANGFAHFRKAGLFDKATAARLKALYQMGSSRDSNELFEAFNGGPARVEALLEPPGA